MKKYLIRFGYFILGILALLIIASVGLKIYFETHKTEIVQKLNDKINENIDGKIHIGDIHFKFLAGFPNLTLAINDVEIKDKYWEKHRHTLLKAKEVQTQLGLMGLFKNEITVNKIVIRDARIDAFVDENGLSNSNIFKPKDNKTESATSATIGTVALDNVTFISENRQRNKLFHFDVASLKGKFDYDGADWHSRLHLDVFAKSMAFNTKKGSFIRNKRIKGILEADFSGEKHKIDVVAKGLAIGEDDFDILAYFNVAKNNSLFGFDINTKIKWKNASDLLADNISSKLNHFDIKEPLKAHCTINGDLNEVGDPVIVVKAIITDNEFQIPDGIVTDCSFEGKYTNCHVKGKGNDDANSAVVVTDFSGKYKNVPFKIPMAGIYNFDNLVVKGKLKSDFELTQLRDLVDEKKVAFLGGKGDINLDFTVDLENFKLEKPQYVGDVSVKNASLNYLPKDAQIRNSDILLHFSQNSFTIQKITLTNKQSTINVDFTVDNYLNLYYDNPEKVLIKCNVYSPFLDLNQSLKMFAGSKKKSAQKPGTVSGKKGFSNKLLAAIEKCKMETRLKADKLKYKKLLGTNATGIILLDNGVLEIRDGSIATCGGTITFAGKLSPTNDLYRLESKAAVRNVDISSFFTGFDNFGITSFKPSSLKGKLSTVASLKGNISDRRGLLKESLTGNLNFKVIDGKLVNLGPLVKMDKFVKNRDLKNITFSEMKGNMELRGENINIEQFRVSSNVLNFDINGVYSFGNKTNLAIDIPLRNPKDDYKVTNKVEREKLRNKGVVLHLLAADDAGKMKIRMR